MRVVSRQDSKSSKQQVSLLKQLKTKKPNLIHAFTGANVMDGGHFGTSAGTRRRRHMPMKQERRFPPMHVQGQGYFHTAMHGTFKLIA
jgi:hypothetical protein